MKIYVGITDADWFRYLSERNAEEMNFWRPRATSQFKILEPNELFLFKSKYLTAPYPMASAVAINSCVWVEVGVG